MALITILFMILASFSTVLCMTSTPFPQGYSMSSQGTILQDNWICADEPWRPATLVSDQKKFGVSIGATSFYDRMDNLENRSLYSVYGGGWTTYKRFRLNISFRQFEAFGIFYEQQLYGSIGAQIIGNLRGSINASGFRSGLHTGEKPHKTSAIIGFTAQYHFSIVSIEGSVDNLVVKKSGGTAADPNLLVTCGVHTRYNRFGAQGIVFCIEPDIDQPVRFLLGEEYRFSEKIAFNISVSTNPIFIGFGVAVQLQKLSSAVALVNNPDLGWSRGFALLYSK